MIRALAPGRYKSAPNRLGCLHPTSNVEVYNRSFYPCNPGIRFAHPPVGELRWEPPVPFVSSETQNATSLGPSCVQQFLFIAQAITQPIYNTPAPPESEDCLFLNVWTPAPISGPLKPVIVWIYGGRRLCFFQLSYERLWFPTASDLPPSGNNPGFLDQELALAWVQDNIARFGGDKNKVTLMVRVVSQKMHVNMRGRFLRWYCRASLQGVDPSHTPSPAELGYRPTIPCGNHIVRLL
ncbi:Alpha/Beta hydrolase protein [Russula brevipes]|nr:Alpha/Beta hydrolase protein [Russula brevipes]